MAAQVLVVGAGPVGLTMAAELARYGVPVRIIDKAAHRSATSKALVLWSRTLELLARAGCADTFIAAGHRVEAATMVASGKTLAHVSFAGVHTPYPFALMLPQSDTERLLEAHLGALGVTVERQVELAEFTPSASGVEAVLRHAEGREQAVQAAWLIGCDGAHSTVRHALNLPFAGATLNSDWILADLHIAGLPYPSTEVVNFFHEDGVLATFPISPGRYRIIADLGPSQGPRPTDPTLAEVAAIVERRGPPGLKLSDPVWLSGFRINERKVTEYRAGHVFVAGDAAHVHSPAGGQGMNTGMQDAFNLAWKLALVCRGSAAEKLLDSYSAERSAVGQQVLNDAGRLTMVAVMKNHAAQAIRNAVGRALFGLGPVRQAMADKLTEVTIGYPHGPLNGPALHGHRPAPGERVVPVAGEIPVGAGTTPLFALCAAPGEAADSLAASFPALLEPGLRPPLGEGAMWLVRPDGYVACVAKEGDAATVRAYLAGVGSDR